MPVVTASDMATFLAPAGLVATIASNAIAGLLAPRNAVEFEQQDLGVSDAGPPPTPPNPFPAAQQACSSASRSAARRCTSSSATFSLCTACSRRRSALLARDDAHGARRQDVASPVPHLLVATLGACGAIGAASGAGGMAVLESYMAAGGGPAAQPPHGTDGPSFAFQLYRYRAQLRRRAVQICGTALLGSFTAMLTSAAAVRAVGLNPALRLAFLGRNTISALAIEICLIFGVQPPALGLLAAFATGLLAFPFGKTVLELLRVRDPAARGLALAGAAHGGGLLAISDEPEASRSRRSG